MNIIAAGKLIKQGKRVRRKCWINEMWWQTDNYMEKKRLGYLHIKQTDAKHKGLLQDDIHYLSAMDVLADDWEEKKEE